MWSNDDIIIPDYQRNFVWSSKQSSLLIDSFLRGLPVPPLFFYIDEKNRNLVIDGQQRLKSVVYFITGDEKFSRLTGFIANKNPSPFLNKTFADLDNEYQRKIKQSVLRVMCIQQLSPREDNTSAYHIFERLNTGGTPLKPQEIRNCVFRGGLSD